MVELRDDALIFSFPDVHPQATLRVEFQRTLRIPDNDDIYPLPPGLGTFPLRHVDDFAARVPADWVVHGGVMLPMYQSEALWILFRPAPVPGRTVGYPFAIKVAAGKIDAVSGKAWTNDLAAEPQNYVVAPMQPWLDGFSVDEGVIRQFVAMPLGAGYTAEEQITGRADHGGLQLLVHPMKRAVFERRFPRPARRSRDVELNKVFLSTIEALGFAADAKLGLAPGGRMRQEIYEDSFGVDAWETSARGRCFVHLLNSLMWEAVTDTRPPSPPLTAATYARHDLPWFDYYAEDETALSGADALRRLRSVIEMGRQKGDVPLPENQAIVPRWIVRMRPRSRHRVREGRF